MRLDTWVIRPTGLEPLASCSGAMKPRLRLVSGENPIPLARLATCRYREIYAIQRLRRLVG